MTLRSSDAAQAAAEDAGRAAGPGKLGMWIFLVPDAISFAGLLIAYGALRARAERWADGAARFDVALAAVLTYVLLGSSLTMALAVDAAVRQRARAAAAWLWLTVALGVAFIAGQAFEWTHLLRHGVGVAVDAQASSFYACTGWHGAHVLAGVIALAVVGMRRVDAGKLAVAALFWHFVDAVWIVLFTSVYLL
jgi:cytochrome c oxidase subunit 3